ncbi:hypothetical protein KoxyNG13_001970 [Klebsiella pasteurii]
MPDEKPTSIEGAAEVAPDMQTSNPHNNLRMRNSGKLTKEKQEKPDYSHRHVLTLSEINLVIWTGLSGWNCSSVKCNVYLLPLLAQSGQANLTKGPP